MQKTIPNTTGVTPAEMIFRFKPRDKLPSTTQSLIEDFEARDKDHLIKYKGKVYADTIDMQKITTFRLDTRY